MKFHHDRFFDFDTNIIKHEVPADEHRNIIRIINNITEAAAAAIAREIGKDGLAGARAIHNIQSNKRPNPYDDNHEGKDTTDDGTSISARPLAVARKRALANVTGVNVSGARGETIEELADFCAVEDDIMVAKVIIFNFLLKHIRVNATEDETAVARTPTIESLLKKHVYNYDRGNNEYQELTETDLLEMVPLRDPNNAAKDKWDEEHLQCYKLFNMDNLWDFCFNGMLIYCYNQQRNPDNEFDTMYNKLIKLRESLKPEDEKEKSIAIEVFIKMKIEENNKFSLYTLFQNERFLHLLRTIEMENYRLFPTMSETDYLAFTDYLKLFVLAKRKELSIS